jgi:hypothetical protein
MCINVKYAKREGVITARFTLARVSVVCGDVCPVQGGAGGCFIDERVIVCAFENDVNEDGLLSLYSKFVIFVCTYDELKRPALSICAIKQRPQADFHPIFSFLILSKLFIQPRLISSLLPLLLSILLQELSLTILSNALT